MDGFKENNGIIVIGATNLGRVLDPALTRAGRFDNKIVLWMPDSNAREKLLRHYLSKVKCDVNFDLKKLANNLIGFSPAAIDNLVNQATLNAANEGDEKVTMKNLEWARLKLEMGRAKTSAWH